MAVPRQTLLITAFLRTFARQPRPIKSGKTARLRALLVQGLVRSPVPVALTGSHPASKWLLQRALAGRTAVCRTR
jgi:hypothetical protein